MEVTITIDPTPPKQGDSVTIHYSGTPPGHLTIEWEDDEGNKTTQPVTTDGNGNVTVSVPGDAEAMIVTDDDGVASAATTQVVP